MKKYKITVTIDAHNKQEAVVIALKENCTISNNYFVIGLGGVAIGAIEEAPAKYAMHLEENGCSVCLGYDETLEGTEAQCVADYANYLISYCGFSQVSDTEIKSDTGHIYEVVAERSY